MNVDERSDALLDALASLPTHAPRPSRDARTLARCRAAMKPAEAPGPHLPAAAFSHILDRLVPVAVVIYALVAVAEFLRISGPPLD